ncbi:thiamine pyrophosphate-binding protein [Caldivirga maquilingensis]|uniref:thiamine pyrophosphate-binding protein n=1 Tax=Caldivirga maquilingensis TaxID=76887 RepID=UPI0000F24BE6
MDAPTLLTDVLRELRADLSFTVAAEGIMPILRSFIKQGINVVNVKFEPSLSFMGITYSRLINKPGLIVVTPRPGALGVVSPTAEAFVEGDPLIVVSMNVDGIRGTHMH